MGNFYLAKMSFTKDLEKLYKYRLSCYINGQSDALKWKQLAEVSLKNTPVAQ